MKEITSIEELKKLTNYKIVDCFISLTGELRSSKQISYNSNSNKFSVFHESDGTFDEELDLDQLDKLTNIVEAINSGTLYTYD